MSRNKILIADDSPEQLQLLVALLTKYHQNCPLLIASNGQDAFNIAKINSPDLILLDWDMPIMNGIETLTKLKEEETTQHIPVIIITGIFHQSDKLMVALNAGAIDFIRKPFVEAELNARIQTYLNYINLNKQFIERQQELIKKNLQILRLEKTNAVNTLNTKEKEFSMQLLNLTRKNGLLLETQDFLKNLLPQIKDPGLRSQINSWITKIKCDSQDNIWSRFSSLYGRLNNDFFTRLNELFPELSPGEIRLCALIRLNMSSKEISAVTLQSVNSVDVAKHRIRKKMQLATSHDLYRYLWNLK